MVTPWPETCTTSRRHTLETDEPKRRKNKSYDTGQAYHQVDLYQCLKAWFWETATKVQKFDCVEAETRATLAHVKPPTDDGRQWLCRAIMKAQARLTGCPNLRYMRRSAPPSQLLVGLTISLQLSKS